MSLTQAIDELLAYVNEHSELIHCGEEYKEFLRLDSCVYIATHRAKLLDTLPESESENDDIGKTHLPVMWMLDGAIPRTFTWEEDMLTLRTLAENAKSVTDPPVTKAKNRYRGKNVNGRMLTKMQDDSDCHGWTSMQWAKFLRCSKPAVTATDVWKGLMIERKKLKAEKAQDRHRKARASNQWKD